MAVRRHPEQFAAAAAGAVLALQLAGGEHVHAPGVGVLALLGDDAHRRAGQAERLAKAVFQIAQVIGRQLVHLRAVDDDGRRRMAALVGIAQLGAAAGGHRRRVGGDDGLQQARQFRRRRPGDRAVLHGKRGLGEGFHAAAVLGADELDRRELDERQPAAHFHPQRLARGVVQRVGLVHRQHQAAPALQRLAGDVRVLLADAQFAVQHQDHHLRLVDGLQGLDDAEFFDRLVHLRLAPQAGGVQQHAFAPVQHHRHAHAVAGGARQRAFDQALLRRAGG